MQATSLQPDQDWSDGQEFMLTTSFFDAAFTAVSNRLMESIYQDPDVNPATRLLTFISRFSTGYLKPEVVLREGFILEETGMSRSSLYKAKNELLASGQITIGHTRGGNCIYRLAAEFQCLKGATSAQEKANQRWGSAGRDHRGPQVETPTNKENKENLDQQQSTPPQTSTDDVVFGNERVATPNLLADQLREWGISEFMAHKLARSHTPEVIFQAISRVKQATVENPAGYLVSEISRGGYGQPVKDPTKATRLDHEKIQSLRRTVREQDEQAREQASSRVLTVLQHFEEFSLARQTDILTQLQAQANLEGFTRLPGWGETHPLYRGLLAEIVSSSPELPAASGFALRTILRE